MASKHQIFVVVGATFLIFLFFFAARRVPTVPPVEVPETTLDQEIARAVTLVEHGTNPMEGIMALRGILERDSTVAEAHWHLGLFSVQSEQFDKAAYRFEKVLELA